LLSKNSLQQDAACIILLKTLERLKKGDAKAAIIFDLLSRDRQVVYAAAEIIDSRLLGWYTREKPQERDDAVTIYTPLFHILGRADNNSARGTLARAFLYLHDRRDIFEGIAISEELIALSLKRLRLIKEKLCCVYPGRDFVIAISEKEYRFELLNIFEAALMTTTIRSEKMNNEMVHFIAECMEYGDSKNGYEIRIKAARAAGMLVKKGNTELARKIEDLSKYDPYYLHRYHETTGYSMTRLNYPVREFCTHLLPTLHGALSDIPPGVSTPP